MNELFQLGRYADMALLLLRLALASIFIFHGDQKLHYWKMHHNDTLSIGWLALWRTLSIVELIAGAGILTGAFTKVAALLLMGVMIGAMYFKIRVWKKGFSAEGGWEFDLILFASAFLIFIMGAGNYSIDAKIFGL